MEFAVLDDMNAAIVALGSLHAESDPKGEVTMVVEQVYTFEDQDALDQEEKDEND